MIKITKVKTEKQLKGKQLINLYQMQKAESPWYQVESQPTKRIESVRYQTDYHQLLSEQDNWF
jgi:hypothetical protein